jgi:hypothetical protein
LEIDIKHYQLGMKISVPIISEGIKLIDEGVSINSEKVLNKIIASGISKVDVERSHIKELAEKHPECYGEEFERINRAKITAKQQRDLALREWSKAKELKPKPPSINLLAESIKIPDLRKNLSPYFRIDHSGRSYRKMLPSLHRVELLIVWIDDYTDDELCFMQHNNQKQFPELKTLAIVSKTYHGPWPSVRWMGNGRHVFRASFLSLNPKLEDSLKGEFYGTNLDFTICPKLQVITDELSLEKLDRCLQRMPNLSVLVQDIKKVSSPHPKATILLLSSNHHQELSDHLKHLLKLGFQSSRYFIICDRIDMTEIPQLKTFGKLKLQVGELDDEKLNNILGYHS